MPAAHFGPLPGQPGYDPRLPTSAHPGPDKVVVLEDRARLQLPLFVPGDYIGFDGRGIPAPGRAMLLTEEPAVDARPPAHHADRTTVAGVRRHGHRFVARIKGRYLGIFATRQEAEDAVEDAA